VAAELSAAQEGSEALQRDKRALLQQLEQRSDELRASQEALAGAQQAGSAEAQQQAEENARLVEELEARSRKYVHGGMGLASLPAPSVLAFACHSCC
jgi:hypothetical protein